MTKRAKHVDRSRLLSMDELVTYHKTFVVPLLDAMAERIVALEKAVGLGTDVPTNAVVNGAESADSTLSVAPPIAPPDQITDPVFPVNTETTDEKA